MKVQVMTTPGCTSCARLERMLDELGVSYEVVDLMEHPELIEKYRIMTAPGLVVDGELKATGVPGKEELAKLLGVKP